MDELLRIYPNDNLSINIDNIADENAKDFAEFEVLLEKEGKEISKETVVLDIEPGNNYWYFLEPDNELVDGEYIFTLTGKTTKAKDNYKKGSEVTHAQKIFVKEGNPEVVEPKEVKPLEVEENDHDVIFTGEGFKAVFSKPLGGLVSLTYGKEDYLDSKPQVTFWRPLTDTDYHLGLNFENALWLGATIGQQLLPEKYYSEKIGEDYKLIFVYRYPLPGGQESAVIYTVRPDGTIGVETTYSGLATVDYMPAFGMNFKLNKNLDAFKYYGYGPEENYIDTTEGLDLGVFESTVRKNFIKKDRPQETGNRTGVRWAELYNSKTGKGIRFTADTDVFEFAALPYNEFEIEAATTPQELPKSNTTNVRIARKVSGIGTGDYLPEWAKVDAGEYLELKFSISPVTVEVKKETKRAPRKKAVEEPKAEEVKEEKVTSKEEAPKVEPKETPKEEIKAEPKKEEVKATPKVEPKKEVKATSKVEPKKEEAKTAPKEEAKAEPKKEAKAPRKTRKTRKTSTKKEN